MRFSSHTVGNVPTISYTHDDFEKMNDKDRFWMKDPYTSKTVDYNWKRANDSKPTESEKVPAFEAEPDDSDDPVQTLPHHEHPLLSESSENEMEVDKQGDLEKSQPSAAENTHQEPLPLSQEGSAFPFHCRCGAQGDGKLLSLDDPAVRCDECQDWSHISCQRDGRASDLRTKDLFICDFCSLEALRPGPTRRTQRL